MEIAAREMGQREIPKLDSNPRILQYHSSTSLRATSDEVPWCSAFVNWCLKQVGILGTNSAAASSWLHWGKASVPMAGAITVMRRVTGENHVGFFVAESRDYTQLLGGNQRDQVRISNYYRSFWYPIGHRWPNP